MNNLQAFGSHLLESKFDSSSSVPNVLSAWDYIMLAVFLIGSAAVGIVASFKGRSKEKEVDTEEFLMGSRQMSFVPVAISLLVSFNSAILIVGTPAEVHNNGTMYAYSVIGEMMAVVMASFIFVPVFHSLRLTSSFEYLELRFGSRIVRLFGSALLILNNVVYMGLALYAPCSTMAYVTNKAIPIQVIIAISGGVCMLYTAWGGIKAVIWTDVFQSIVMVAGVLAIIVMGLIEVGGFGRMWEISERFNRIDFNNFAIDPRIRHTFWGLTIANSIGYVGTFGVTQAAVQRYCSVPTLGKAQLSVILANVGVVFFVLGACLTGLIIYAYNILVKLCDPFANGDIKADEIVPAFVMEVLNFPPIPGIIVASLFAGALSSVSTALSALSAVTWQDFLKPYVFKQASETKATWINRISIIVYGVMSILLAFVAVGLGGSVLQASLGFTGAIGAPITGLFALGILVPFADKIGAIVGGIVGIVLSLWLSVGAYAANKQRVSLPSFTDNCTRPTASTLLSSLPTSTMLTTAETPVDPLDDWYSISYEWWSLIGVFGTIIPGVLVSIFTCRGQGDVNESLVNPQIVKFTKFIERKFGTNCRLRPGHASVHPMEVNDNEIEIRNLENDPTTGDDDQVQAVDESEVKAPLSNDDQVPSDSQVNDDGVTLPQRAAESEQLTENNEDVEDEAAEQPDTGIRERSNVSKAEHEQRQINADQSIA